ncbi:MAG: allophanate hydrolase subunit 1 [Rhodococcus sp.]|nr:allophanate hydrolase subunit 1 [Rhodococcus sp. (in: high G+C Gram-positive bacteria)]
MIGIRTAGRSAVLAEFEDLGSVLGHFRALDADRSRDGLDDGVIDLVPAARTILVRFDPTVITRDEVGAWIRAAEPVAVDEDAAETVTLPVRYDGDDLGVVASLTGLAVDEVIAAHTSTPWTVAFSGFAPGFGYLVGGDPRLAVPRRDTPRTSVPAGSVGLAGEFSGVYPRSSPGGWQLIGTCEVPLWDVESTPPAVLRPGMRVQFTVAS